MSMTQDGEKPAPKNRSGKSKLLAWVESSLTLHQTPDGEGFAVPTKSAPVCMMLGAKGGGIRSWAIGAYHRETGEFPNMRDFDDVLALLAAKAATAPLAELHLRSMDEHNRVVIDLGINGDASCIVITPSGWTVEKEPPRGVFFRRTHATRGLPIPDRYGNLDELREIIGLAADDTRWLNIVGFLVTAPFASVPRPILFLYGEPGSGKTLAGRYIISVLDPREHLGSAFGKNLDDDRAHSLSRYLVSFDNIGSVSEAVSDAICRLVTGESSTKRRLYTDNEAVTTTYKRTGVITGVKYPNVRNDALERLLLVELDRISGTDRRGETQMDAEFKAAHPRLLGAVCTAVSRILKNRGVA